MLLQTFVEDLDVRSSPSLRDVQLLSTELLEAVVR